MPLQYQLTSYKFHVFLGLNEFSRLYMSKHLIRIPAVYLPLSTTLQSAGNNLTTKLLGGVNVSTES